jgi:hypothetical protein
MAVKVTPLPTTEELPPFELFAAPPPEPPEPPEPTVIV